MEVEEEAAGRRRRYCRHRFNEVYRYGELNWIEECRKCGFLRQVLITTETGENGNQRAKAEIIWLAMHKATEINFSPTRTEKGPLDNVS